MTGTLENLLEPVMQRHVGGGVVNDCNRLSGGASMESWSFDFGGAGYILRRAPSVEMMADRPFDHATEAALVQMAHDNGVTAPEVIAVLHPHDELGSGYIMRRVEGEVSPAIILRNAEPTLIDSIARELAAIHAIVPGQIAGLPCPTPLESLEALEEQFESFGGDRPIIALALKWCRANLPPPLSKSDGPRLVHGDFRMGNLMVADNKVAAVLDWELAHMGDRHEDLAWGCVGPWRFSHYDSAAFGLTDLDHYFAAYEAAGGAPVDRARFHYWLIHRTVWWALGCLQMGATWRSGGERSLERAAISRRTIENEIDLLMLLEGDAPEPERGTIALPDAEFTEPLGETSTAELLGAIREWLSQDIKPQTRGRDKFFAAVAINSLNIAGRNLADPAPMEDRRLADAIRDGTKTLATPGLLADLRRMALRKGRNDCPKYPGFTAALEEWT